MKVSGRPWVLLKHSTDAYHPSFLSHLSGKERADPPTATTSGARRATISEEHGQRTHTASMKPLEGGQRAAAPGCEGPFSFGMVWGVVGLLMGEGVRAVEVGLVPGRIGVARCAPPLCAR